MTNWGININPRVGGGQPDDPKTLKGVKWVRAVFKVDAARVSLDDAMNFYDGIVSKYNGVGANVLFVLNQETFWGNGPWENGDWEQFAGGFAERCGLIAKRYRGKGVAWEIWNEGDLRGGASVYVEPEDFAKVLSRASAAIRAADAKAPIVLGGLAGPDPITYVTKLRKALNGRLPLDAIGIHPYGQVPPSMEAEFDEQQQPNGRKDLLWGGWFGKLKDAMWAISNAAAFQGLPLWITEIGVSEDHPIPEDRYPMVIKYMKGIQSLINQPRYFTRVPVVIWFAWGDIMRQAGIVNHTNQPKPMLYAEFFNVVERANAAIVKPRDAKYSKPFKVVYRQSLRVRKAPDTTEASRIKDVALNFGQVVYVDPNSRTEGDGYVWWQHDLGWSASARLDGTEYLMLPLDAQGNVIEPETGAEPPAPPSAVTAPPAPPPPVSPPAPTTVTFRVVTNVVNIRSAPRTGSDTLTTKQLKLGEIVKADAASQTTMNGFIWWKHDLGWSASRSVDNNQVFMEQFEEGAGGGARQITNILEVPWYSQVSATASRAFDCGQTCVLMLLRYYNKVGREMTVNDLTAIENGRTTFQELQGLAWRFGLALAVQPIKATKTSMESIKNLVDQGKPAIVLVNYLDLKLPNSLAAPPHADPGLHWLVIRGYDEDRFLLNDPLWVEEEHRRKYSSGMIPVRIDTMMLAYRNSLLA